jgi:hypothetical protein
MAIKKVSTLEEYRTLVHSAGESDITLITEGNVVKYDGVNVEVSIPKPNDAVYRDNEGGIHFIDRKTFNYRLMPSNWVFEDFYYFGWADEPYVDMGDGLLWAKRNIDVTQTDKLAKSAFQYECSFFSWGNVDGHNPSSTSAFSYNWGSVNNAEPWYEGQPYGSTPGASLVASFAADSGYDAARQNLGGSWRMPTNTEHGTLFYNINYINANGERIPSSTTDKRALVNGIRGLYLESKTNGHRLFFACSGVGSGGSWNNRGSSGNYWSSSFYSARDARYLVFYSGGVGPQDYYNRYYGIAVRPVQN